MRRTIGSVVVLTSFILLADMFLVPVFYDCYPAIPGGKKIFVGELPGGKERMSPNFFVNSIILQKIFPGLTNPREPSVEDIGDTTDQYHFIAGGFGFVLFDDFNNDGLLEVALVGKHDNKEVGRPQFFFAILSIEHKAVTLQYFVNLGFQRILLQRIPKFFKGKYAAILSVYTFETEHCDYLFWDGKRYVTKTCDEVNR